MATSDEMVPAELVEDVFAYGIAASAAAARGQMGLARRLARQGRAKLDRLVRAAPGLAPDVRVV